MPLNNYFAADIKTWKLHVILVINEEQYYYNMVKSKFLTIQIQIHFTIWNDIAPKPNKQVHNFAFVERYMSSPVGIHGYVTVYVYTNVWRIDECMCMCIRLICIDSLLYLVPDLSVLSSPCTIKSSPQNIINIKIKPNTALLINVLTRTN
jgi:hypothetical protein